MVNILQVIGKQFKGFTIIILRILQNIYSKQLKAVIHGSGFGTDEFIRLSYATSMNNINKV